MSTSDVVFKTTGSLAEIIFNRPAARNAMTWPMYDALIEHCDAVDADGNIRVLILRGAGGKAFVAGTDISQFKAFKTDEDGLEYERRIDRVVTLLEQLSVPTIAAIHGVATGGGMIVLLWNGCPWSCVQQIGCVGWAYRRLLELPQDTVMSVVSEIFNSKILNGLVGCVSAIYSA